MLRIIKSLFILFIFVSITSCATSNKRTIKYRANRNYSIKTNAKNASLRDEIIINAAKYAGTPYKYGGKNPHQGLDCSGFVSYVFDQTGINAPGASYQQAKLGSYVPFSELKPGDLLFFGAKDRVSHVAIVYSTTHNQTKVIHSTKSRGVVVDDITNSRYWRKKFLFAKDIVSLVEHEDYAQGSR